MCSPTANEKANATEANSHRKTSEKKWLRPDRPYVFATHSLFFFSFLFFSFLFSLFSSLSFASLRSLQARVSTSIEAQRHAKLIARLTEAHAKAAAELHAAYNQPTAHPNRPPPNAEALHQTVQQLSQQLRELTAGKPPSLLPPAPGAVASRRASLSPPSLSTSASTTTATASKLSAAVPSTASSSTNSVASRRSKSMSAGAGAGTTLSATGSASAAASLKKVMEHTGVYQKQNAVSDGPEWSCCLASDRNAPGCTLVRVSKAQGWNWADA